MRSKSLLYLLIITIVVGVGLMARGHEDWFINKAAFGKALQDVGELGARFGLPFSFTRSGKVIYSDGFEADITPWRVSTQGAGSSVTRDTTYPFRGLGALYLHTDTGAADFARVDKLITYLDDSRTGMEFLAWFHGASCILRIGADVQTPTLGARFKINIHYDGTLEYLDTANNYVQFGSLGGGLNVGHPAYFLYKMVIDMKTGKYAYLRVNETIYDMSALSPYGLTTTAPGRINWLLQGWSEPAGWSGEFHIDDVTITVDEP